MPVPHRLIITIQDIKNILGCKKTKAFSVARKIRLRFNKLPGTCISIEEFCQVMGLKEERVIPFLIA